MWETVKCSLMKCVSSPWTTGCKTVWEVIDFTPCFLNLYPIGYILYLVIPNYTLTGIFKWGTCLSNTT